MATIEETLQSAIDGVLNSNHPKKLVVAGPGAGKTTLFRLLLERSPGNSESRLVLTFINNLKADLEDDLGELASVFTLHGYAQSLLHRHHSLRGGLTENFECLPGLATLIKKDWKYLKNNEVPKFFALMRNLESGEETDFYLERGNFYNAVDFDDSVFRLYSSLSDNPDAADTYDLVLIDEYQDFNKLDAGLIDILAERNSILIAGDDDQALYSQLRGASWDYIRSKYEDDDYEVHELPFCMRCPEVMS